MKELLALAEARVNELLNAQGYVSGSQINDIWNDILREHDEQFASKLKKGNVTFIDFSKI